MHIACLPGYGYSSLCMRMQKFFLQHFHVIDQNEKNHHYFSADSPCYDNGLGSKGSIASKI